MKYALFSVPVGTIYDLPQPIKEGETGSVSTIGDEGLYGQACQVRTAPGGVTAAGVHLASDVAEVVSFTATTAMSLPGSCSLSRKLPCGTTLRSRWSWRDGPPMSSTCPRCRASG